MDVKRQDEEGATLAPRMANAAWATWTRQGFGLAQILAGVSLMPGVAYDVIGASTQGYGHALRILLIGTLAAAALILAGAKTAGPQRAAANRPPSWAVGQVMLVALLAAGAWIDANWAGALLLTAAAICAWAAVSAWMAHHPGGHRRGALFGLVAGLAYVLGHKHLLVAVDASGTAPMAYLAQNAALVPAILGAGLALGGLLYALLDEGGARRTGVVVVMGSLILAAISSATFALNQIGPDAWRLAWELPSLLAAALVLGLTAAVLVLIASCLGLAWAVHVLVGDVPPLVRRLGRGFADPDPGEICTGCGWIPLPDALYCMRCGHDLQRA